MFTSGILWRCSGQGKLTVRMVRDECGVHDCIQQWVSTLEGWWLVAGGGVDRVGGWVLFVEYLVEHLIGFNVGWLVPLNTVVWGVLGCVVMTSWEIGDVMCVLLVVGVSAWFAGCSGTFIVLQVVEAWWGLTLNGGSQYPL